MRLRIGLATIILGIALVESGRAADPAASVYSNQELGFRYTPPAGMQDKTAGARTAMQARAAALKTGKVFDLLLAMESSRDDSPSWHSITIETYPRNALPEKDDLKAESQMNAWVAGSQEPQAPPKRMMLSGQTFAISVLALQEGALRKGAVIWTTIRKGKLLSFAFVANDPEQLKGLTETIKTVQFF
jgi:hypothetical protein